MGPILGGKPRSVEPLSRAHRPQNRHQGRLGLSRARARRWRRAVCSSRAARARVRARQPLASSGAQVLHALMRLDKQVHERKVKAKQDRA
jgi:hypothetical protein